jgi:hypothetical protein
MGLKCLFTTKELEFVVYAKEKEALMFKNAIRVKDKEL